MKKIIKISCCDTTKARMDGSNPMIFKFLPNKKNIWQNCEFFWNDASVKKADYWVIIGDVFLDEEECEVDKNNVIFMTGEPQSIKRYDASAEFVNQFGRIFTSHEDFKHPQVFPCRPPINWWIDEGSPIKSESEFESWQANGLGYDDFKNLHEIKKDKLLSVFCSAKVFTEGHRMRFNFCQKLKKHFGDKIDWFGAGVNPIQNKYDGIASYKYTIVLENFNSPNYVTEKLLDPYMVLTYPIYCGATNISEYFSDQQVTEIDIKYPKTAIAKIESLIEKDRYEKSLPKLVEARDLVMDKYNLFNLIYEIAKEDENKGKTFLSKNSVKIKKEQFFLLQNDYSSKRMRKNIVVRVKNSLVKKLKKIQNFLTDYFLLIKFKIG